MPSPLLLAVHESLRIILCLCAMVAFPATAPSSTDGLAIVAALVKILRVGRGLPVSGP